MAKKYVNEFPTPYTVTNAVKTGGVVYKIKYGNYGSRQYRTSADCKRIVVSFYGSSIFLLYGSVRHPQFRNVRNTG